MDTMKAFVMGSMNRHKELMVFDWNKAAKYIKENNVKDAEAGLENDFEWTAGDILKNGSPVTDSYTYLASTWATPILVADGEEIECFKMQSMTDKWDADTKWPESALNILKGLK